MELARLAEGRKTLPFENRFRHKDGSYCWLSWRAVSDSGHLYAVARDVTELKNAEEQLRASRRELAQVSRQMTVGAMTASIAHEVNQPLSGIVTNASTCLRMLNADPANIEGARATVQRTLRDARRASDIIQHLRAMFARKQSVREPIDLNEAADEVINLLANELHGRRVSLRTAFDTDLPPVMGDRVQLQQVIMNLVVNAADAMKDVEGRPRDLLVATRLEAGGVARVLVRDCGVGIDPDSPAKLFEAFYTTKSHGMGVGLSVSRSIIENHDGRLWAAANDGPGATFSFTIPRIPAPAGRTGAAP